MEIGVKFINIITDFLVRGMFFSVLMIIIGAKLFKDKIDIKSAITIIRVIVLSYAVICLLVTIIQLFIPRYSFPLLNRATGPYWYTFWIMMVSGSILPLLLFSKKLQYNTYFILSLSIFMNIGWLFERVTIYLTSLHRDYIPGSWAYFTPTGQPNPILTGLAFGGLTLGVAYLVKKKSERI